MPGKVKVRIVAGRNLPVMDRASDTCDAFVEMKLSNTTYKTEVFRHSLNPEWNSEWFKFEVDDEELQDEPLQIRVMDYDTYSANDAIGKVYIDLNPLLCKEAGSLMSGWFPIYDTMHGIRGEINVMVRVHLFSDSNKYRESSCGVQFFYSRSIPQNYKAEAVLGFVEELVVNDDPEYQWIDKIRTPRASNEARQTLFSKLSGEVQRKIGLKALELGGNAVIGYHQYFDLEGESGIVVRGIGTAVILKKHTDSDIENSSPKDPFREQSPSRVTLHRVLSNASMNSVRGSDYQGSHLFSTIGSAQARSRSPSPKKFGLSPQHFKKGHSSSISPKRMTKVQSDTFCAMNEPKCTICKETSHQTEKVHQLLHSTIPGKLKRFASCKSSQVNISRLKRICSDPLYPRSPLLEEHAPVSTAVLSSPPGTSSKISQSPVKGVMSSVHRRSSDSDLSSTPKGNNTNDNGGNTSRSGQRTTVAQESLSMLEYPFITMKQFPSGFIHHVGGIVSARSVKLLGQINNPDEPETRDAWWTELRKEIRSHVRSLGCNVVLGYTETTNISDDICVLSVSGTAAVLNTDGDAGSAINSTALGMSLQPRPSLVTTYISPEKHEVEKNKENEKPLKVEETVLNQLKQNDGLEEPNLLLGCEICHIPYSESSIPFPVKLVRCNTCRKAKVPDILFMTIDPPANTPLNGKGCLIQARVCKMKKDCKGEQNAKEVSDCLPFLEYEMHRQLINKLKVKSMNSIFGLKVQVSIGDKLIIGTATGTAAYISALPPPSVPKISCGKRENDSKMAEIQKQIQDAITKNKEFFEVKPIVYDTHSEPSDCGKNEENNTSEEDLPDLDFSVGNKDACILEVDDSEDVDIIAQLVDLRVPIGFDLCNTEILPGVENLICNLQMFTRIFRTKFFGTTESAEVSRMFENVIKSLFVKLRRLVPCCLTGLDFQVDLVDQDEIQITVLGIAVGLGASKIGSDANHTHRKSHSNSDSEMIFIMDEDRVSEIQCSLEYKSHASEKGSNFHESFMEYNGVDITPLSYVPGKKIEHYLGDLDFFFIRESNSIRESGGLNGFIQSFIAETLAIVRAHVCALGGNAMVAFHMSQCIVLHNPHKNQGQCLVNVAGDAVFVQVLVTQFADDSDSGK